MSSRSAVVTALLVAAACGDNGNTPRLDAHGTPDAPHADARRADAAPDAAPDSAIDAPVIDAPPGPHRHTIAIDGTNDFTAGETFQTTSSPTFTGYVTWDDTNLYVGYAGPDLAHTTAQASGKWLFVFIDPDLAAGSGSGASTTPVYNTQHATFPAGFTARYYLRIKSDGTFATLEQYDGSAWTTQTSAPTIANQGTYTEAAIPRALVSGATAGVVTYMINETALAEGSYAGLYANNFTDGYGSDLQLAHYLKVDFASHAQPNDAANEAP